MYKTVKTRLGYISIRYYSNINGTFFEVSSTTLNNSYERRRKTASVLGRQMIGVINCDALTMTNITKSHLISRGLCT